MSDRLVLQRRPGSVTAGAVLAIIYGSLFTLCGLCGVAGLASQSLKGALGGDQQQEKMQKQVEEAMERDVPAYRIVQVTMPILGLALAFAMFGAGIGLIGMHSWARKLAVIAALIAVASSAFQAFYQAVFVIPATAKIMADVMPAALAKGPGGPPPGAAAVGKMMETMIPIMGFMVVVLYVLVIVYLLIIVFLLQQRHVSPSSRRWRQLRRR